MWIIFEFLRDFIRLYIYSWFNKPKWLNRITLHFILFVFVFKVSNFVFHEPDFLHTDVDSARYMLSALVQSEAAIIAIVITLSLVGLQLSSSSYSARVIDVFKKTPDLHILIVIYGIAIFYGLGVLKLIKTANPQLCYTEFICLANLEVHISYSYYLGIFAYVSLVPYIMNTLDLLKPFRLIKILSQKITKKNIMRGILEQNCCENDPIQPITDIIVISMTKYEYETVKQGLNSIAIKSAEILKKETLEKEVKSAEGAISRFIFNHLETIGRIAVSRKDDISIQETIVTIGIIAEHSAKQKLNYPVYDATILLGYIGKAAAKQKLEEAVKLAAQILAKIEKYTVEQELSGCPSEVVESLRLIGISASEERQNFDVLLQILTSLEFVGISEIKNKLSIPILVVESIEKIGKTAAENNLEDVTKQALNSVISIEQKINEQEIVDTNGIIEEHKKKIIETLDGFKKK